MGISTVMLWIWIYWVGVNRTFTTWPENSKITTTPNSNSFAFIDIKKYTEIISTQQNNLNENSTAEMDDFMWGV